MMTAFLSQCLCCYFLVQVTKSLTIPDYMASNTIIEYVNTNEYIILQSSEYEGLPILLIKQLKMAIHW